MQPLPGKSTGSPIGGGNAGPICTQNTLSASVFKVWNACHTKKAESPHEDSAVILLFICSYAFKRTSQMVSCISFVRYGCMGRLKTVLDSS